jgi:hypothetical protein
MHTASSVRCEYCFASIRATDLTCRSCGSRANTLLRSILATIILSALIVLALAIVTGVLRVLVEPLRFF